MTRRKRMMAELEQDIRDHIERETQDNIERGMSPEEARRAARLKFGNLALVREDTRAVWTVVWLEQLWQDVQYGLRMLRKTPGFTTVAILVLALGIGANSSIFSLVDAVMLRTLPVLDPQELVLFTWTAKGGFGTDGGASLAGCPRGNCVFPYPAFESIHAEGKSFAGTFAFLDTGPMLVSFQGHGRQAQGDFVSGDFFSTLGVRAALGRTLEPADDSLSASPAIVLSDGLWQRQFGADPEIVGKAIYLKRHPFRVAGVMAPGFFGLNAGLPADFWVPMAFERVIRPRPWNWSMTDPRVTAFSILGRLKPGVSVAQAQAVTNAMFVRDVTSGPDPLVKRSNDPELHLVNIAGGLNSLRRGYSQSLVLLLIVTGIILLLASANVAGLALARAVARQKEVGVRLALGARRWRLVRQLLAESLLVAVAGGVTGTLLAYWGASGVVAFFSASLRGVAGGPVAPLAINVHPDLRMLGFAIAVTALVAILAGLVPAVRATEVDLAPTLKESFAPRRRGEQPWRRMSPGSALVVVQVALSILLLTGAGLLVRSIANRETVAVGFRTKHLLTFDLDPTLTGMKDPGLFALYRQLQVRISGLPGVVSDSYAMKAPMEGGGAGRATSYAVAGGTSRRRLMSMSFVNILGVGPEFFTTFGIPVMAGRGFTTSDFDSEASPQPVIVSQTFAKQAFGGENPLGRELTHVGIDRAGTAQIVGVVPDISYDSTEAGWPSPRSVSLNRRLSWPLLFFILRGGPASFEVRTAGNPEAIIPRVRQIVAQANGELVLTDMTTVTQRIDKLLYRERLIGWLSSLFALLALLLACVGLYGLLAWEVTRRTREIGIRMALGAGGESILRLVLLRGARLAIAGIIVGLGLAFALTRLMRHFLFGVSATDPVSFVAVAVLLLAVALVACWIPARRAMRVEPAVALRQE